jgi:GntR family transcriptional regulator, galactonate operon transcriptional repressor
MKSSNKPKLPKSVARSAMHEIGLAIIRGEFPPGSILPNEDALAARAGVGRPALREAIKVLSGKGLVRTARRYGSRVCPRAEWNLLDPEVLAWHLADPENWPAFLRDTVEMRQLLEPMTAALAAQRATDDEIARLQSLANRIPPVMTEESLADDVAYHTTIMRASHNGIMAGLAPSMEVLLRAYFAAVWQIRPHGPTRKGQRNRHIELARAIADRDAAAARAMMEDMLTLNAREIDELIALYRTGLAADDSAAQTPDGRPSLGQHLRAASAQFLPT